VRALALAFLEGDLGPAHRQCSDGQGRGRPAAHQRDGLAETIDDHLADRTVTHQLGLHGALNLGQDVFDHQGTTAPEPRAEIALDSPQPRH